MTRFRLAFPALSLAFALFFGGCTTDPSLLTGERRHYAYSWEQELQLGAEADKDIVQQMGLYPDDELSAYVKEISHRVLEHSSVRGIGAPEQFRDTEFTFRVLDSPVVNAFALPGGFVYVTRGLLAHAANEAQLAVVIGHEIVHVEARHASQQALKQQLGQLGLMAGAIIGQQVAENQDIARQILDVGSGLFQLLTLKYGRDAERESDRYGVEYAAKAGYAAEEGSHFFRTLQRLSERSGQAIPTWMSSHPDPGEREQTIRQLASEWREQHTMEEVGHETYLQRIEGLIVGENPRHGYTDGRMFYHPELRFQFETPIGWEVINQTSAVYVVEPNGNAVLAFSLSSASDPAAAAQQLQQQLGLQATSSQPDQINGMPAYALEGAVQSQSGVVPVMAVFAQFEQQVYTFLGYGAAQAFAAFRPSMRQTAYSFQELANQEALSVQPYRLAISRAERSAPFREFLPQDLPPDLDAEAWAIINQLNVDDTVEAGRYLKLPTR